MRKKPPQAVIEPVERSTGRRSYQRVPRNEDVERVVVWLDEALAEALDAFVARCSYDNRSDAARDLIRSRVYSTDGAARTHGRSRASREGRRAERERDDRIVTPGDAAASAILAAQEPKTLEQLLVERFGPTMTYGELATVLKRREGGLRQTLCSSRAPWCQRLIAARRKVGRRSFFRTPLVAAFLEEYADADLDSGE